MTTQLIANIGIGNQVVRNDFDNLPIYREMQKEIDVYGNLFIRIPKFYIKKESIAGKYLIKISKEKMNGYYLPYVFYDFEKGIELDYFLYGAYEASLSADGQRLESKPGAAPLVNRNIVQFRTLAQANGKGYQINDIHAIDVLQALFYVEFGTLYSQSIHPGRTNSDSAEVTGVTDSVVASSGAMGLSAYYPFKYRGIENPWGNVYEWIDGVNILDRQAWVARDAENYVSNVFAKPYEQLSYMNCKENGYVREMGFDTKHPYAEFPTVIGGNATTFYSDYYYQTEGQRVALFGGSWTLGSAAGLSCWALNASSATSHSSLGGRLLKKPLS